MNEDPRAFRRRRIEAGLSQTDLAKQAGVAPSHISDVENGRAGFSPKNLEAIADALGCTIPDLLLPEPDDQDDTTGVVQAVRAAIEYPCPACDADRKRACLTPAGQRLPGVHRARIRAAERDGHGPRQSVA